MARKEKPFPVAFAFYECPYCHKKGSIGFLRGQDEDQHFEMQCEHKVPIIVEGRLSRAKRLAEEAAPTVTEGE